MKRILIATPAKGGLPGYYFRAHDQLREMETPGVEFSFVVEEGQHSVNLSRNIIAEHAITENYDRLILLDKDHPYDPKKHMLRLASHEEDVVGGLYCKKRPGKPFWLAVKKKGAVELPSGLVPANFLATGFLSISVAKLREMKAKLPERAYQYEAEDGTIQSATEFFPIGIVGPNTAQAKYEEIRSEFCKLCPKRSTIVSDVADFIERLGVILERHTPDSGRLLGEDYHFCHLARRCGLELFIDTKCIIPHEGNVTYPIEPEFVATPAGIAEDGSPDNGFNY